MSTLRSALICFTLMFCLALVPACQKADEQAREVKEEAAESAGALKEEAAETAEALGEKASETAEPIKEEAADAPGDLGEKAAETAEPLKKEAAETSGQLKDRAEDLSEKAAVTAGALKQKAEETVAQAVAPLATGEASGAGYIGAQKCKACHLKQYKSWSETTMATSFENLKPGERTEAKKKAGLDPDKDYTLDEGCVKCHSTGYGKGGFVSIEETPHLAGVQCEACHGAGGEFSVLMKKNKQFKLADAKKAGLIIPSEDEKGCRECHNSESPFNESLDPAYAFNFKERLEKTHEHFPLKYEH